MSEVIVRMKMPRSCPCELADGYEIPFPCFAGHGVPARHKEFDQCVKEGTKPDWCPFLCELPEQHGSLGDLDELATKITQARIRAMQSGEDTNPYWECSDLVLQTPTIVPATKKEAE